MTQLEIVQDLGYATVTPEIEQLAKDVARILGAMIKKFSAPRP